MGFDNYVQVVNGAIAVDDKSGTVLAGPISETTFWANQPDCAEIYTFGDAVDGSTDMPIGGSSAVQGRDRSPRICAWPSRRLRTRLGGTIRYAFGVDNIANGLFGFLNDYAKPSVFPDAHDATGDPNRIFTGIGNTISAFERPAMLAGNPLPQFVTYFVPAPRSPLQTTYSHMPAADLDGRRLPPQGTPEVRGASPGFESRFSCGTTSSDEFHVDWNSPPSSTLTPTASLIPEPFNSHACTAQACIKQRGTTNRLDSLSYGYMMQRLTYRNFGTTRHAIQSHRGRRPRPIA